MSTDIDDTLRIFNKITGTNDLSKEYMDTLSKLNLTQTDGYIIKLKLNQEILSGNLSSKDVISRLNLLLDILSKSKSQNNHRYEYDKDALLFLYNQVDNKVLCKNCGTVLLPIDKYCYNCGQKQVPRITLFELLSSINSTYIKPGDIIKINKDNTIEKTTFNENNKFIENILEDSELELLYENKIKKSKLNYHYSKIILLNYINTYKNINYINIGLYKSYDIDNIYEVLNELLNEKLIELQSSSRIMNKISDVLSVININDKKIVSDYKWTYSLTKEGLEFLNSNKHVLIYDFFVKDSVADDIIEFDKTFIKDKSLDDELFVRFLNKKREEFNLSNNLELYLATYTLEAYYFEYNKQGRKRISSLFKRFISSINMNYSSIENVRPLDADFINFLNNVLSEDSLSLDELKMLFNQAYSDIDQKLIFNNEECINYLFRCFNGDDLNNMNFELSMLFNERNNN